MPASAPDPPSVPDGKFVFDAFRRALLDQVLQRDRGRVLVRDSGRPPAPPRNPEEPADA